MKIKLLEKVRGCDVNGATVNLNFKGDTEHQTLFGGLASMLLKALILGFFCMQTIAVWQYNDPTISSYQVLEDRSLMEEPLNLKDYSVNFYFFFIGPDSFPKQIDPTIGSFAMQMSDNVFENDVFKTETTIIEYQEVDMETDKKAASLMPYYKKTKGGIYTPKDLSQLKIRGSSSDAT